MPRNIVGGIAAGDDFFDREDLLDHLWRRLPRQSVELIAPRRFGKTSVMRRLVDQPRHGVRVLFIDCETFDDPRLFVDALFNTLVLDRRVRARRGTARALRGVAGLLGRIRGIKLDWEGIGVNLADPKAPRWSSSIEDVLAAVRKSGAATVVIVDEFSMMLDNLVRARIDPTLIVNLLTWFRDLRLKAQNHEPALGFVLGGSMSLEYWLRRLEATALMSDVERQEVSAFDVPTAAALIVAVAGGEGVQIPRDACDEMLVRIDPPIPFWIHALISFLVQEPGRARPVTAADVSSAYRDRLIGTAGRHYFQPFEERLGREDPVIRRGIQRVLTYLARLPWSQGVARSTLATLFARVTGNHSPEVFDAVFADLQSDYYIRYDPETDLCYFAHKVLRDWWRRWHPTAADAPDDQTDGD